MLELNNISFNIGARRIIHDISLQVNPEEFVAIVGSNGAGKSTLLKMIAGSVKPSAGNIYWEGKSVDEISSLTWSRHRAVLTQSIQLSQVFDTEEVIMLGRYPHFDQVPSKWDTQIVQDEMEEAGLSGFRKRNYSSLSGGEQQRVQVSRAMVQLHSESSDWNTKLLLLDEPLNNLDIKHQHQCMQRARDFAQQGNITIAIVHDINMALQYADKILFMKNGRMLAYGFRQEVLSEALLKECFDYPATFLYGEDHTNPFVVFNETKRINELMSICQ